MSTKEQLRIMIDNMTDEQANALFIVLHTANAGRNNTARKKAAYEDMQRILQRIPAIGDIDEKAELAAYRDERYGEGL